jgi:hypothetical protein
MALLTQPPPVMVESPLLGGLRVNSGVAPDAVAVAAETVRIAGAHLDRPVEVGTVEVVGGVGPVLGVLIAVRFIGARVVVALHAGRRIVVRVIELS